MTTTTPTHANRQGHSDVTPFEIVAVACSKTSVQPRRMKIRAVDYVRDPSWSPNIIPGGFAGHCDNNHDQRWIYTSNPANRVFDIRLHKDGRWYDAHGGRYNLSDKPVRFYDYNF